MAISSLLSRILGLVRDNILANKFGALHGIGIYDIDTYYAAFRIPDLLFNLLIYGTISSVFIPIFIDYLKKDNREEGWKFTNATFNLIFLFMLAISVIALIFAPWITKLTVPGFSEEKLQLTVTLTRIMLLSPLLFTLSSFAQSIQNAFNYFVFYSLAPILYNLGIIGGALLFADQYGVYGLTIGVLMGGAMNFLSQIPALYKMGYHYKFILDTKRKDVMQMIKLVIPRIIGLSANQIIWISYTIIASTLGTGMIAIYNYGINLQSLPMGIIGISFSISSFSALSLHANIAEKEKFIEKLSQSTRMILFLIIPATMGIICLKLPITKLILETGKFGTNDVILTANTLGILIIGLLGNSLTPLFVRAFYAWKNTKTPVLVSLVSALISIISALIFTKIYKYGIYGLGIGFSLGAIVNIVWLLIAFKTTLGLKLPKAILNTFVKSLIASLIMFIFIEQIKNLNETPLMQVIITTLSGILIYFAISSVLNSQEIKELKSHFKKVDS